MIKRVLYKIILLILIYKLFRPGRHAAYYNYIQISEVLNELIFDENKYVYSNQKYCSIDFYKTLILSAEEFRSEDIYKVKKFTNPRIGGEYIPNDCKPIFQAAVIVPYRNRTEHLKVFLNYFHSFLQNQKIHYKIIIVEQNDNLPFNRAKLLNVGANEAYKMNISCLILHDVDLFPLNPQNIYACSRKPRHMSSSIDIFRYNLPYIQLFGGVGSIAMKDFQRINGMSNVFDGWGAEDDDLFRRLEAYDLIPYRFAPEISRYTMLVHKKNKPSKDGWAKLKYSLERQMVDGLTSIPNNYKVELESLYTHIIV